MDKNLYLIDLSESEQTDFGRVEFALQSPAQQVFSAVWELESQINSGGFEHFFRDAEPTLVEHAAAALKTIGANQCAAIVEQAVALLGPLPTAPKGRKAAITALEGGQLAQLEALDSKFFAYPDPLTELLFAYVQRHPEIFGPIPSG